MIKINTEEAFCEVNETFRANTRVENDSIIKILQENKDNLTINIKKRFMGKDCEKMTLEIIIKL